MASSFSTASAAFFSCQNLSRPLKRTIPTMIIASTVSLKKNDKIAAKRRMMMSGLLN
jgi:hypothetical protein